MSAIAKAQAAKVEEVAHALLVCTETLLQYLPKWARNTTVNVRFIKKQIGHANRVLKRHPSCGVKPYRRPTREVVS